MQVRTVTQTCSHRHQPKHLYNYLQTVTTLAVLIHKYKTLNLILTLSILKHIFQAASFKVMQVALQSPRNVLIFSCQSKMVIYLCKSVLSVQSDNKPLLKIFTDNTDKEKCNTWDLEAATIPKRLKVQHIKNIAIILADSVSRLKAVGLYHDLDFQNSQPELGTTFETLPPMEQATHTPVTVHKISIEPNVKTLAKQFTISQIGNPDISLEDVSPKDEPHLEHKVMSLSKFMPDKIIQLQKNYTFC